MITTKAGYKMLVLSLIIAALVLITACSFLIKPDAADKLPQLADIASGKDYEIRKISGHPESTFAYIKTNQTYIVSTHLRTYERYHWHHFWRIDKDGKLTDSFASKDVNHFSFAGVFFDSTGYYDWPLTGDKNYKHYHKVFHSKELDAKTLNSVFASSEQILWDNVWVYENNNSRKENHYYLKQDDEWLLLKSDGKFFNHPKNNWPAISHISLGREIDPLTEDSNEGKLDRQQIESLYPLIHFQWTDTRFTPNKTLVDSIRFLGFKKSYSVSPSFMSQNGWTGKVGRAQFQLMFNQQTFDFQTYTRAIPYANHEEYDPDLRLAHSIPEGSHFPFLLVQLNTMGLGTDRVDTEAGIYILRQQNSQGTNTQQSISNLSFKGFNDTHPKLRWISDANGTRHDWPEKFSSMDVDLPASIKFLPIYMDFYFDLPKSIAGHSKFNVIINDQSWRWENAHSIYLILYFDPDEMTSTIKKVGGANLKLSITAELQDKAIKLIPVLESAERSVTLKNVRVVSQDSQH
jgi:hypothetical protein